jgi:hypothetical protein
MKYIEFVCQWNVGRSPLAEAIGQEWLDKQRVTEIAARSSGAFVAEKSASPLRLVQFALGKGIYDNRQLAEIQRLIASGQTENLWPFYEQAQLQFNAQEKHFRDRALERLNIRRKAKDNPEQTIVRADNLALFALDRRSHGRIKEVYANQNHPIYLLGEYATDRQGLELPNCFGLPESAFIENACEIAKYVPRALEKLLSEVKS